MAVAIFLLSTGGYAQIERKTDSTQKVQKKQHREQLYKELNFNAEQGKSMKALQEQIRNRTKEIHKNPNLTKEEKKGKLHELRSFKRTQMNKILSREQQAKMKDWQKQRRKNIHKKDEHHRKGNDMRHKNAPQSSSRKDG